MEVGVRWGRESEREEDRVPQVREREREKPSSCTLSHNPVYIDSPLLYFEEYWITFGTGALTEHIQGWSGGSVSQQC
ncbi:hypothetical protein ILYODFUR_020424 [Ilyodon furcidens]|uniref:Uncharacterized protein n=1 Tax=Ilyodon furcidens TaxID=33524 RepID=A0ABV0UJM3_9TELE